MNRWGWVAAACVFFAARSANAQTAQTAHTWSSACGAGAVLDELTSECVTQLVLSERTMARARLAQPTTADAPTRNFTARNAGLGIAAGGYFLSIVTGIAGIATGALQFGWAFLPVFGQPIIAMYGTSIRSSAATALAIDGATVLPAVAMQVSGIALAIAMHQGSPLEPARVSLLPALGGGVLTVRF